MIAAAAGLAAGAAHVVTGPDHLAAVAPLALDAPRRALRTGALWGIGHGVGVGIMAALGQLLRDAIDLAAVSAVSERLVGVVLIAIGIWALWRAGRLVVHAHPHGHAAEHHHHAHVHASRAGHARPNAHARHRHASLWIGALHGVAGGGHLLGVLPSLALPPAEAAIYVAAYFVAAVVSMATVGLALGKLAGRARPAQLRAGMMAVSLVAVAVGGWWIAAA